MQPYAYLAAKYAAICNEQLTYQNHTASFYSERAELAKVGCFASDFRQSKRTTLTF
jgi:hypothetical protein